MRRHNDRLQRLWHVDLRKLRLGRGLLVLLVPAAVAQPLSPSAFWCPNVQTRQVAVHGTTNKTECVSYTVYEQKSTQIPYECTRIVYKCEQRTAVKKTCVYVDEKRTRMRKVVQYNDEKRTRMRKELTYNTVTKTVTVPHVSYTTEPRTKEVSYTYNVPECTVEEYEECRYDRVAEEVVEEYTVCVPYCEMEERKVQVCKMVPKLVPCVINPCDCSCGAVGSAVAGAGSASGCGCGAPAPAPCCGG